MSINTMYENFYDLNFDKYEDLCYILCQDKHTRIEGLCSETAFIEDVVEGNLAPVTSDFWFTNDDNRLQVYKLIINPAIPLSDLDYKILDKFTDEKSNSLIQIIYFDEPLKEFRAHSHKKGERYKRVEGWNIISPKKDKFKKAPQNDRIKERIDKACFYLDERGLLKDAAIKRIFANCWLGYQWDIDTFTMTTNGQIVALEIKHKFPTKKGTYGLNSGQKRLFNFLMLLDIPTVHVILKKPIDDTSIHGVDFLTDLKYIRNTVWLYTRFLSEKLYPAINKAPNYTSIFGQNDINYDHIDPKYFGFLKNFGISEKDVRRKLLAGLE